MLIVDTNVIAELMRPAPHRGVAQWFDRQPLDQLAITAITVAEILHGLELMPDGRRKVALVGRFELALEQAFAGHVLPFDDRAAVDCARIKGQRDRSGRPIGGNDAMIAAIARVQNATIATRNVPDFEDCGVPLLDPWKL